ncbi:MAG TPA: hypothetical protein VHU81_18740 [Thermoanaerobaculia bacterium]|nr:hypothetical protein [Thermoanaerobaculia bacterium]
MVYARNPGRFTLPGLGGPGGAIPRDLLILLGVLFATYSLQFFHATAVWMGILQLTPFVWLRGLVWQVATYPFIAAQVSPLWFLLGLLFLFWFGRDVYAGLGRRHFWRMVMWSSVGAALVAVLAAVIQARFAGLPSSVFFLMQGQQMLMTIFIAAFATANRHATIYFMFVLPIQARWFLGLEIVLAFLGFLTTKDFPGFLGICAAVGLTYSYLTHGFGRRGFREIRLRIERWWIQQKLERAKRKRGLRVIQGKGQKGSRGPADDGEVRRGPWVH